MHRREAEPGGSTRAAGVAAYRFRRNRCWKECKPREMVLGSPAAGNEGDGRLSERAPSPRSDWRDEIFAVLKQAGVAQIGYVPDAGHARLIELAGSDREIHAIALTTEEEGIAVAAGAWLGGQRAALLMQSSGVGNCVNMFSLLRNCGFGCVVLVTMRGEFGEFNPWQVPMGTITEDVLRLCDFLTYRADSPDAVGEIVGAGCDMAFNGNLQVAILLSQRLIGPKIWTR